MIRVNSRVNKIEAKVNKQHGKKKLFFVEEFEGRYFIEKDGKDIEIEKPVIDDPNTTLVIVKLYSDPTKPYEMQKDTK